MATNHPARTIIIFITNPVGSSAYLTRDYTSLIDKFCILFKYKGSIRFQTLCCLSH
ncbi:hypothetical protein Mettu_1220 [Methylobacter tundripaludum SV96]|uniref:Uncharacterized protein n=1 Tax=Methylobacter tundripaludum (strain ATCC BAA-1195 / DSM 17260 / SV96) TaxID=697282 RepID=G3IST2_METTV|nr:hypothetical protein Mettu_1220 [Methylobacter tundripaludum SV96]